MNLQLHNHGLPKVDQPLPANCHPELDVTPLLKDDDVNLYQSYISILRWIVELGRLDIYVHVAFLSSYLTNPRVGHMKAVYQILGYLKDMTVQPWSLTIHIFSGKIQIFLPMIVVDFIVMYLMRYHLMHLSQEDRQYKSMPLLMQVMLVTNSIHVPIQASLYI